jgi:hypothetical protein
MQLSSRHDALSFVLKECRFAKCPDVCFVCEEAFSTSIDTPPGTFIKALKGTGLFPFGRYIFHDVRELGAFPGPRRELGRSRPPGRTRHYQYPQT